LESWSRNIHVKLYWREKKGVMVENTLNCLRLKLKFGRILYIKLIFLFLYLAHVTTSEFFYQLMHYLLDIQNVKIYIKILYSRSYMFRVSHDHHQGAFHWAWLKLHSFCRNHQQNCIVVINALLWQHLSFCSVRSVCCLTLHSTRERTLQNDACCHNTALITTM
jgi:hypothetical protein